MAVEVAALEVAAVASTRNESHLDEEEEILIMSLNMVQFEHVHDVPTNSGWRFRITSSGWHASWKWCTKGASKPK